MVQSDLILANAAIYTMDPTMPTANALSIRGDKILALGDGQQLRRTLAPGGKIVDLQGCTVVPGFIDAHLHFLSYSLRLDRIDIHEIPTRAQALEKVSARAAHSKPGEWILGGGWNCNLWEGGDFPTRHDLDSVAPDNPVLLSSKDGHSIWFNTAAMKLAHLTAQTPTPPGGNIMHDAAGEPTGILQEDAIGLISDIIPRPTLAQAVASCKKGLRNAHRVGLTGIHDCEGRQALAVFQELARLGELTMRVLMHIPDDALDAAIEVGLRDGFGDEWVRIYGIKAFADGALGSRSAWMLAPYESDPANCGIPTIEPQDLHDLTYKANQAGLSVAVHAIGDAANRLVLDAVQAAQEKLGVRLRNRIEHVQILHPADIARLAQLGVVASMQPIHATSDMEIADLHWGQRAGSGGYAWRSLLDSGATLAFGSDAPVEDFCPLRGIHAAVTRRRPNGFPGPDGWYPEQRLSVHEAVYAYTMGAAFAGGEEQIKGSLTPGKLADLVVLERDIFEIEPVEIASVKPTMTIFDGRVVYRA